jgi:hypothetical protein
MKIFLTQITNTPAFRSISFYRSFPGFQAACCSNDDILVITQRMTILFRRFNGRSKRRYKTYCHPRKNNLKYRQLSVVFYCLPPLSRVSRTQTQKIVQVYL